MGREGGGKGWGVKVAASLTLTRGVRGKDKFHMRIEHAADGG